MGGAKYWTKQPGSLKHLVESADEYSGDEIKALDKASSKRMLDQFDWSLIVDKYEQTFIKGQIG